MKNKAFRSFFWNKTEIKSENMLMLGNFSTPTSNLTPSTLDISATCRWAKLRRLKLQDFGVKEEGSSFNDSNRKLSAASPSKPYNSLPYTMLSFLLHFSRQIFQNSANLNPNLMWLFHCSKFTSMHFDHAFSLSFIRYFTRMLSITLIFLHEKEI